MLVPRFPYDGRQESGLPHNRLWQNIGARYCRWLAVDYGDAARGVLGDHVATVSRSAAREKPRLVNDVGPAFEPSTMHQHA